MRILSILLYISIAVGLVCYLVAQNSKAMKACELNGGVKSLHGAEVVCNNGAGFFLK